MVTYRKRITKKKQKGGAKKSKRPIWNTGSSSSDDNSPSPKKSSAKKKTPSPKGPKRPKGIKLGICVDDMLGEWVPIKVLGGGMQGTIYEVCNYESCEYILKINASRRSDYESTLAREAAKIGVGPKVYHSGVCSDDDGESYEYIIIQKLAETMEQHYPYKPDEVVQALKLYYKLIDKKGIVQKDLKPQNIMFDRNGRMYIIDYGLARRIPEDWTQVKLKFQKEVGAHMEAIAKFILNALFNKADEFSVNTPWDDEQDLDIKYNQYAHAYIAVNKYFKTLDINIKPISTGLGASIKPEFGFKFDDWSDIAGRPIRQLSSQISNEDTKTLNYNQFQTYSSKMGTFNPYRSD